MESDFSVVPNDKRRDSGHKLVHRKFDLNIRKEGGRAIEQAA